MSSCVVVALIENYNISKPLKGSPEKSHILSCDTVVANERYIRICHGTKRNIYLCYGWHIKFLNCIAVEQQDVIRFVWSQGVKAFKVCDS